MDDDCGYDGLCAADYQDAPITKQCLKHVRESEGRCPRCGNWPTICGHGLSFKEKMKSISVDYSALRSS